ncbi:hypothetical protein ACFY12_34275 [Streptomyces sp. NPDC001339]|uniref:hypothetical protein n=1 Tax=Streptomyces sp. NPDC001339 TaxID=3364563 RepID=UPI003687E22A
MNGEKHNGEKPQPTADDLWAPVTVSTAEPETYEGQLAAYEQDVDAAGYGETQRQRYIEGSGQDAEYAACQWDEMIVPAAEAAGIIPARPIEPVSPAEQAREAARSHAMGEYWQQRPVEQGGWDPLTSNDPAKEAEFQRFVEERSTRILQEVGPDLAERIERNPDSWGLNTVTELYAERTDETDIGM